MNVHIKRSTLNILVLMSFLAIVSSDRVLAEPPTKTITKSITIVKNVAGVSVNKYILNPGDVFSFSVYDEPTFAQPEILVRPDGYATIEPIGEVCVAGHDISELTKILEEKMSAFVKDPQISINIRELHPASIFVYGAVQKPGTYQQVIQADRSATDSKNPTVKTDLTVSNILANAGGITYDADLNHILITSPDNTRREINLWKLIKDGDTSQNIVLRSGDSIYIPKLDTIPPGDEDFKLLISSSLFPVSFPVSIIGEVNKSGLYNVPGESPYLSSVIALASGYTLDANKRVIKVYRRTLNGKVSEINVNPKMIGFVLRPNDLVEIDGRKLLKTVRGADYITRLMGPFATSANIFNGWADVINPSRRYRYY